MLAVHNAMKHPIQRSTVVLLAVVWLCQAAATFAEPGLVGHWKLQGDCRDSSGHENHGVNHGVDLDRGAFDGESSYIEVPNSDSLRLGTGDFTICAWINTPPELDDIVGDIIDLYDPALRRGITLSCNSSAGGYQSQGTDRHVHFGIDNARTTDWQDCGRPNATSNYVSNSLTVYKGSLYAATTDAQDEEDWCHVYRYAGGQQWIDCGRVGDGKTTGVVPLIVHNGELYAATSTYDWTRVKSGGYDPGRVYRYLGGTQWEDCGQPSDNRTLNCLASYKGKLYVGGGPETLGVYVHEGGTQWKPANLFPPDGPKKCFPHAMCRHNGKLFVAFPVAYAFDGNTWTYVGSPLPAGEDWFLQTHSLEFYQGKLHAGTWPTGKVAVYEGGEDWKIVGRVGVDGTEVNALTVYNGKLYGGSIPRAEVCRYDGTPEWTSLKRFYSPEGWLPALPGHAKRAEYNEWSRVTSLTVYDGKLFASTGSCTASILDAPADVRGKVFGMEAGKVASYDDDLGPGWKHIAAVRDGGLLKLYIDGRLVAQSASFDPAEYDVSTDQPLRIGFGQTEYFAGQMADVQLYKIALSDGQIQDLSSKKPE
jgi:Concanavalin A-like lectin/glucanases superfamily